MSQFKILTDETKALYKDFKLLKKFGNFLIILKKLKIFEKDPLNTHWDIKFLNLKSQNKLRLRIGHYRVIYSIDFGNKIILIH